MKYSDPGAGCIQRIPPTSAGRETSLLLLVALLVVILSGSVVLWRGLHAPGFRLQDYQLDLATALTPAEQGIHADLQAAFEEWRLLRQNSALTAPPGQQSFAHPCGQPAPPRSRMRRDLEQTDIFSGDHADAAGNRLSALLQHHERRLHWHGLEQVKVHSGL